ncbi:MAG: MFS transporter, partial [Bdellovibrionota bacterium]
VFGGAIQALIFTVIGDSFPEKNRGAATGTVMSSFSLATIVGVPVGIFLAESWGWRIPFLALGFTSIPLMIGCLMCLPSLREHMSPARRQTARREFWDLRSILRRRKTLDAI